MAQQMYAPSYGYGQETKQVGAKKPVVINYYPSGNTNNPQRVIAQVETVTREVVRNPGTVVMSEPLNEARSTHHGDGQLRREDEFVNKLQNDLNDASRSIIPQSHHHTQPFQPQVLGMSTNLDQPQYDSGDPSHPRKVAELVNRVSNWRGANGNDRGKPASDGYDTTYGGSRYGSSRGNKISPSSKTSDEFGYGNRGRPADEGYNRTNGATSKAPYTQQGYDQPVYNEPRVDYQGGVNGYGNRGRPADEGFNRTYGTTIKPPSTQQGYDQPGYNEPRVGYQGGTEGSNGYGNRGRPADELGLNRTYGTTIKVPSTPQGYNEPRVDYQGGVEGNNGYGNRGRPADEGFNRTYGTTSKPPSAQQAGYDPHGYNEPRVDYQGGVEGSNGYGNRGRPADEGAYTRRNGVNPQSPRAGDSHSYTIGSNNRPIPKQEGYDQYGYNGGVEGTNQLDGGYTRRNGVNPHAPRAAGDHSPSHTIGSTARPVSKQEGYDQYGYNEPRVGYHGGGEGSMVKPVASNQSGFGYGVDTGNGYGSGLPRPAAGYVERPVGATSDAVITSVEAVSKYKGTFVPMMRNRREEESKMLVKI